MLFNPQRRLLYVDDDEDSRSMLSTLLKMSQIDVKAVGTAAEALSLTRIERFDLFLIDAWLPGIDGFDLCRKLRASEPDIPVLFFSSAAYEADRKRGIEAGAVAYVVKPDLDGLLDSISIQFADVRDSTNKLEASVEQNVRGGSVYNLAQV